MPGEVTTPPPPDSVAGYVAGELVRLEALLEELSWTAEAGRLAEARLLERRFELALEHHARVEEDLLLPVFEARTGVYGPATSLRAEHRDMENGVALMRGGLASGDLAAVRDGVRFLRDILPAHCSKEHILFPAVDLLLSAPERARLMQRLRPEASL
jgi:hypothetical protein